MKQNYKNKKTPKSIFLKPGHLLQFVIGVSFPWAIEYIIDVASSTIWTFMRYTVILFNSSAILGLIFICVKKTRYLGFGLITGFLIGVLLVVIYG